MQTDGDKLTEQAAVADSSAVRVALWRAMHVQIDPPPHGLRDELGLRLAAPDDSWRRRPDMDRQRTQRCAAMEHELDDLGDTLGLHGEEREAVRRYYADAVQTVMRGTHDGQKISGRYSV